MFTERSLRVSDDGEFDTQVWVGALLVGTLRKDKSDHYVNTVWAIEERAIPAATVLTAATDSGRPRFSVLLPSDWEEWEEAAHSGEDRRMAASSSQPETQTQSPPAAWHPDPLGRFHYRWWDGAAWTAHVSTNGQAYTDPPPG